MPEHQIRAIFNDTTIRVYQAYSAAIAVSALDAGRFVAPFKMERMTWIKPSFNWMMYRSGFASKPGQEFVLGIDIRRDGFEWALAHAVLSSHTSQAQGSREAWQQEIGRKPVRVQWDPERDWRLRPIDGVRAIQVGLSGEAVERYVREWTVRIEDVTALARLASTATDPDALPCAREAPYPLPAHLAAICRE